jgi:hypothetical protein
MKTLCTKALRMEALHDTLYDALHDTLYNALY